MTQSEAATWLEQVDGKLFRTPPQPGRRDAWVAVVETPRQGMKNGKLIVALGGSMQEATLAAEHQWRWLFEQAGPAS